MSPAHGCYRFPFISHLSEFVPPSRTIDFQTPLPATLLFCHLYKSHGCPTPLTSKRKQPMTPQFAKTRSMQDPNRCNYRFPNDMRCRLIGFGTQPFCPKHTQVAVPPPPDAAEIASTLTVNLDDFTSAAQINDF